MSNEGAARRFHGSFQSAQKVLLALLAPALAASISFAPGCAAARPVPATAEQAEAPPTERWYRVEVAGQSAGLMVERTLEEDDLLITESEMNLEFRRGGAAQKMALTSRFVETRDHRPVSLLSSQALGARPIETHYRFTGDGVIVSGASGETLRPLPEGEWLTPLAAQAHLEAEVLRLLGSGAPGSGIGRVEARSLDPALGLQPVTTMWVLEKPDAQLEIDGELRPASLWQQTQSFAPQVKSLVHLSPEGELLRSATPMLGLEMVVTYVGAGPPGGDGPAAGDRAPELLVQSFIYPDRRIPTPREARFGAYRFLVDGVASVLPTVGYQRQAGDTVLVDLEASGSPRLEGESDARYLAASTYIPHRDAGIRALHGRAFATESAKDPAARAERLRRLVARHLTEKNLDSVLATAAEAATSRSGDCTEHAVLLAALLRADGIPARVATGVIYVERFAGREHLFAYHMWTQALIEGRWRDLDATLEGAAAFDAAHLTLDIPDLDDEGAALMHMAAVAPLIGRASVEVLPTAPEQRSSP
ncbi:MAG: transglutaminase-like domain-containing protein [Acidobacteriota bacterium]